MLRLILKNLSKLACLTLLLCSNAFAQLDQVIKDKIENEAQNKEAGAVNDKVENVENPSTAPDSVEAEKNADGSLKSENKEDTTDTIIVEKEKESTITPSTKPAVRVRKKNQPIYEKFRANPANQQVVAKQLNKAPEDASFLYETRYIPLYGTSEEFLPPDLEQEVIIETLERQTNKGFQLQLPNLIQTSVIAGIVFLFLLYKRNIKKSAKGRRYSAR